MAWSDITDIVGKAAPILGGLLGGSAGESIGRLIATTLGVENTPEAVANALKTDPETALKLAELESNQKVKFQELATSIAIKEYDATTQNMSDVNATIREEVKSEHFLSYSWRPLIGYSVAISTIGGVVISITAYCASLLGRPEGLTQLPMVLGALAALNATTMPVLGVASYFRGKAQADPNVPFSNKG